MSKRDDIEHVVQQLLQDHQGDHRAAFYDLAHRFVAVVHGTSPGFLRWPPDDPTRDAKPVVEPVDDGSWIKTALGDA
jgi:hypothetical protein